MQDDDLTDCDLFRCLFVQHSSKEPETRTTLNENQVQILRVRILYSHVELLILSREKRKMQIKIHIYIRIFEPKPRTVNDAPKLKTWNDFLSSVQILSKNVYKKWTRSGVESFEIIFSVQIKSKDSEVLKIHFGGRRTKSI